MKKSSIFNLIIKHCKKIVMVTVITVLFSSLSCIMFPVSVGEPLGDIIYVPDDYPTIQGAIDAASDGDTIYVNESGSPYVENIVIDKQISLIGNGAPENIIIQSNYSLLRYVIKINADYINISGFGIDNAVVGWGSGVLIESGVKFCNISENNIKNNGRGIHLSNSANNIITNNNINENDFGIDLRSSANNNTITNNNITKNNMYGVYLTESGNNQITNNNITQNDYDGIYLTVSTTDNIFYHNNFIENNINANDFGNNIWDNGYPSGGNFWDDYTGTDNDGDGIGDTSYIMKGGDNNDRYPLMVPWGEEQPSDGDEDNDTDPPTKVLGLGTTDAHDGKLDLFWNSAIDNVAVSYYKIYRDDTMITTITGTTYQDTGLINDQTYNYQVSAVDTSGNEGAKSNPVTGTPTASETPPEVGYGWVYGTIYLKYLDDTLPAKNTTVCLYPQNSNGQNHCTKTRKTGEYFIEDALAGTYTIQAQKNKYVSDESTIVIYENTATLIDLVITIDENRWEIEEAIETGNLGGEISVEQKDENTFEHEIIIYETIDIDPVVIKKGDISLMISGDEQGLGKTVLIDVDYNVFDAVEDIVVEYDGENIDMADDINDALNPNNDGLHAEYLITYGSKGIQILVSIPHYSEHEIRIYSRLIEEVTHNSEIVIFIAILVIITAAFTTFKKGKE